MLNVTVLPGGTSFVVPEGANLLEVLREHGYAPDAPCGGQGTCGKCLVTVNGREVLSCQFVVSEDCEVVVPETADVHVLEDGAGFAEATLAMDPVQAGDLLAVDIGTTTVVAYLLDGTTGAELSRKGMLNPQAPFGADVISRIEAARTGHAEELRRVLSEGLCGLAEAVCTEAGRDPAAIGVVAVVGNPAMQQLFLGLPVDNLAAVPFAPALTKTDVLPAADFLSCCPEASLLVVPDIGGYIGADTVGCVLATRLWETGRNSLLIDIGTNGEMVLSAGGKMAACSTAAGPALEGAKVRFGMRGAPGAIDMVSAEDGHIAVHTIENKAPVGICGSGLIDAVAVALDLGLINKRGRILSPEKKDGERFIPLTDNIWLTQNDIREVMLAKGAIAAGVELLADHLGLSVSDIDEVLLAGAFGSFLDPDSACRIGLLPEELRGRTRSIGNAAGAGAKRMACSKDEFASTQRIVDETESVELANLDDFMSCFARNMNFREGRV